MAYYENLPIYKKTMELAVFLENVVRNFSRYHKYAIGAELRDVSRRLFTLVIRANSRRDKVSALAELRDSVEEMKALDSNQGYRLLPLYEPHQPPVCLKEQYHWAVKNFGARCVFFQVGRFFEFFGKQALLAARIFGCALVADRRGLGRQCGFPVKMLKRFKERARHLRLPYVVIAEQGYCANGLKRRVVTEKLTFCGARA